MKTITCPPLPLVVQKLDPICVYTDMYTNKLGFNADPKNLYVQIFAHGNPVL